MFQLLGFSLIVMILALVTILMATAVRINSLKLRVHPNSALQLPSVSQSVDATYKRFVPYLISCSLHSFTCIS